VSGWNSDRLQYDLTPKKARYYFRRSEFASIDEAFAAEGLIARYRHWGGWSVHATTAQIWFALSGIPSRRDSFVHEGAKELIAAGFFTEQSYAASCGLDAVDLV